MFKHLFMENGHYTEEANRVASDIAKVIRPYFDMGYSPRELYTLVSLEASMLMSCKIMEANRVARKANPVPVAEQSPEG